MTPEQHADNIAKWSNAGLRQAVIDEIAAAVATEREACANVAYKLAEELSGEDALQEGAAACRYVAAAIRARGNGSK